MAQRLELDIFSSWESSSTSNPDELLRLERSDTDSLILAHLFLPENSKRFGRLDFIVILPKTLHLTKKVRFDCHNDRGDGKIDRADHQKIINRSLIGVSVARSNPGYFILRETVCQVPAKHLLQGESSKA